MNSAAASPASWTPALRRRSARAGVPGKRTSSVEAARQADRIFDRAFELAKENFDDLWEELTDQGRQNFVQELVDARFAQDHIRAMSDVIDAWYRTLELRYSQGYSEAMVDAGKSPVEVEEPVHTIEELRGLLKR
ncbi:MAG: hypothetical protein WCC30_10895 [Candidatus Dormiibacterota bacterium]